MAVVSGYVNAVGRDSRPITDVRGKFVEQIEPGAFRASLERSENVDLLLNHDKSRVYASTRDGNLRLTEDSIGLRAEAVLTDAEMIRKARSGEFRGWSFGMYVGDSAMEERAEGIPRRHVKSLNMFEVSLIDKSRIPCYVGTSVECRAEGEDVLAELRYSEEEPEIIEEERSEPEPVDYSAVDDVISELRYGAVDNVIAELRYNPYHDPSNGRFTSGGGGGGGGVLVVEKGQKGKGYYVVPSEKFQNNSDDAEMQLSKQIRDEFLNEGLNSKFPGIRKKAEEGTGNYGFKNAVPASAEEVEKSKYLHITTKGDNTLVEGYGGSGNHIFYANKTNSPAIQKLVAIQNERHRKITEVNTKLGNGDLTGKTTTTYERWRKNQHRKFDNYYFGASRSFDPIDSVIEELRSSDPADGG